MKWYLIARVLKKLQKEIMFDFEFSIKKGDSQDICRNKILAAYPWIDAGYI